MAQITSLQPRLDVAKLQKLDFLPQPLPPAITILPNIKAITCNAQTIKPMQLHKWTMPSTT